MGLCFDEGRVDVGMTDDIVNGFNYWIFEVFAALEICRVGAVSDDNWIGSYSCCNCSGRYYN